MSNFLRTLYFGIFESHLRYGCQIWGQQKSQHITGITDLHQKASKSINFKVKYSPWKPLFKGSGIMIFPDILRSENCLLVLQQTNQTLPTNLQNMFKFSENQYTHNTRFANNQQVSLPQVNTTINFNFTEDYQSQNKFLKAFRENIFS